MKTTKELSINKRVKDISSKLSNINLKLIYLQKSKEFLGNSESMRKKVVSEISKELKELNEEFDLVLREIES